MARWWLVHTVGDSDLGVSASRLNDRRAEQLASRLTAINSATSEADLTAKLRDLAWDGPVTATLSPLGFAAPSLPAEAAARLLLVATGHTAAIAEAIRAGLQRAPTALGRRFDAIEVVRSEGRPGSGGLDEDGVREAMATVLPVSVARSGDHALITWGSGSTQLTLAVLDTITAAGVPWQLGTVNPVRPAARYQIFNPADGLNVDPLLPLLRRWRHHDRLATMIESGELVVAQPQRNTLLAEAQRWRDAHLRPSADGLRLLMADALARCDATSGFAVRRYVFARYQELRAADDPRSLDLEEWASGVLRRTRPNQARYPVLGDLLHVIARPPSRCRDDDVQRARDSRGGQWLRSKAVQALNEVGTRSSHRLMALSPALLRSLRAHLAEFESSAQADAALPTLSLVPATTAWYVGLVSGKATGAPRPELMLDIAELGADGTVCGYLGLAAQDVGLRFLVLGTRSRSIREAGELAAELNARPEAQASGTWIAQFDGVPDPGADPPFDVDQAYELLSGQFERIGAEVGAIVLVPTGPRVLLLPLILAGQRLAIEQGLPFYVRQLNGQGRMHRISARFGADRHLLDIALHALSTLELDVAARLLDSCSGEQGLARRIRALANALCCRIDPTQPWPGQLSGAMSLEQRTLGLIAQRLEIWAWLAETCTDATHAIRAVFGACAVIEQSVRRSAPPDQAARVWGVFRNGLRRSTSRHAAVLNAVFDVRNALPASHGQGLASAQDLDALVGRVAGPGLPAVNAATLLRAAVAAARKRPGLRTAEPPGRVSLRAVFDELVAEVRRAHDDELLRLARMQIGEAMVAAALREHSPS